MFGQMIYINPQCCDMQFYKEIRKGMGEIARLLDDADTPELDLTCVHNKRQPGMYYFNVDGQDLE